MSDVVHAKKPGIAKHASPMQAPSSGSGGDSDEEYGKIVEDKELKHPIIKKTLSKYGVSNDIVKKFSVQNNSDGDSDEEYGKPVKDPELVPIPDKLQHPIVQTRSLSRYGSITIQKPIIENPRSDSDDEYGTLVEEEFVQEDSGSAANNNSNTTSSNITSKSSAGLASSSSSNTSTSLSMSAAVGATSAAPQPPAGRVSGASLLQASKAYMGMLRSKTDVAAAANTPGKPNASAPVPPTLTSTATVASSPPPTSTPLAATAQGVPSTPSLDDTPVEDDPEYQALLQRGYKREQASMIIKRKRSRQSISPTASTNTLSTATNGGNAPGHRLMSFSDIPLVSVSSDDVVEHKSPDRVAVRPTAAAVATSKPLTSNQERSVQNLMSAGMTREDATLYVCSGASNMTEVLATLNGNNATTNRKTTAANTPAASNPASVPAVATAAKPPSPMPSPTAAAAAATPSSSTNVVRHRQPSPCSSCAHRLPIARIQASPSRPQPVASTPPARPSVTVQPTETNHRQSAGTPTAIAMSVAAPAESFLAHHAHNQHEIAMTPAVHAEVIVEDDDDGSASGNSALSLSQVYADGDHSGAQPPAHEDPAQQQQSHPPPTSHPSAYEEEEEEEDDDAMNQRIQVMIEEQRAEFGVCMYDVLKMEDEGPMRRLIAEGYRPEDAVRLIFERKGYVSSKPLPQPRRQKPSATHHQAPPPPQPQPQPHMQQPPVSPYGQPVAYAQPSYGGVPATPSAYPLPHTASSHAMMPMPSPAVGVPAGGYPPLHPSTAAHPKPPLHPNHGSFHHRGPHPATTHDDEKSDAGPTSSHGGHSVVSSSDMGDFDESGEDDDDEDYGDEHSDFASDYSGSRPGGRGNNTELPQYKLSLGGGGGKGKTKKGTKAERSAAEENDEAHGGGDGSFGSFLRKKTMRKMKVFLGLPVGDHHLKRDKFGNVKSEDERIIQKKLRYKDSDVQAIINMGFTKEQAIAALAANKNKVNDAVNALLAEAETSKPAQTSPRRTSSMPPSGGAYPPTQHPSFYGGYPAPMPQPAPMPASPYGYAPHPGMYPPTPPQPMPGYGGYPPSPYGGSYYPPPNAPPGMMMGGPVPTPPPGYAPAPYYPNNGMAPPPGYGWR